MEVGVVGITERITPFARIDFQGRQGIKQPYQPDHTQPHQSQTGRGSPGRHGLRNGRLLGDSRWKIDADACRGGVGYTGGQLIHGRYH